jgi:hypothetical protein
VAWSLLCLAEFREGGNGTLYVVRFLAAMVETTVAGSDLSAFDMSTGWLCVSRPEPLVSVLWAYRRPQSSHSRTGFQPIRLVHISHLAVNSPLVKMSSNGFHPTSPGGGRRGGETFPLDRLAPGFRSVKR